MCYAEKTHGAKVLSHISTAKSPQAVMGTLVKRRVAAALGRAVQVDSIKTRVESANGFSA